MFLDYFALTLLIVISVILIYAAIYIHDIPYEMAVKRKHPHQDAIHYDAPNCLRGTDLGHPVDAPRSEE